MNRTRRLTITAGTAAVAVAAALTVLMPTASGAPIAATASDNGQAASLKPTVVLVHGGFADSSNWNGVIKRLQEDGYPVVAPANPLRGLPTDATYISSFLSSIKGPVVLVGHSYGGAVITNAAVDHPNVKALVYVAAFMPDKGDKLGDLIQKFPGSEIQAALNQVPFTNADGSTGTDLYLQPDRFRDVFAADLSPNVTRLMAAEQRPFSASSFTDATTAAAWHTVPSWGIVATADKSIPPALERFEYQRAGSHVVEAKGASHVVMISQPGLVTNVIEDAAQHTD